MTPEAFHAAALAFLYAFQASALFNDLRAIAVLLKKWS